MKEKGIAPIMLLLSAAGLIMVTSLIIDYTPLGRKEIKKTSSTERSFVPPSPPPTKVLQLSPEVSTKAAESKIAALLPSPSPSPTPTPTPEPIIVQPIFKSVLDYLKERLLAQPTPTPLPSPNPSPSPSPKITNPTLSLSPNNANFNRGCNFSVDINLDTGGKETAGTDVELSFDKNNLNVTSLKLGNIYQEYLADDYDNSTGEISITGTTSFGKSYSGTGKFATVNFRVQAGASTGNTQVKFAYNPNDKTNLSDSNIVSLDVTELLTGVENGNYTIGNGSCN